MNFKTLKYVYAAFLLIGVFLSIITAARLYSNFDSNYQIIGSNPDTLGFYSFWADFLAAIASFSMVFITAVSVNLNEKQLTELKRQWEEEHKPYLTCHLVTFHNTFRLCVSNSSNVVAKDVQLTIDNHLEQEPLRFGRLKDFLERQSFIVPPRQNIYFPIMISAYCEEDNLPKGYIEVSIKWQNQDFESFKLFPSNHAFVIYENDSSENETKNSIDQLSAIIKNKKFI